MEIGIMSDIHGNIYALERIFKEYAGIDHWIVCGDYAGYYYYMDEVISLLGKYENTSIIGNHDHMFLDFMAKEATGEVEEYSTKYGNALKLAMKKPDPKTLEFLRGKRSFCSAVFNGMSIGVYHGSPWDPMNEYIYPDDENKIRALTTVGYDVVITGHTHIPFFFERSGRLLINPGAVGQPRDWDPRLSFGILDVSVKKYRNIRLEYDTVPLMKDIKKYDQSNLKLREFLTRKR